MGLLGRLFGKSKIEEAMEGLDASIDILRMGVFNYLRKNIYASKFDNDEAAFWAMAVLNTMDLFPPGNEQARIFYEKNEDQIWQETLQIKKYPELSGNDGGSSCLYFASLFYAEAMKNNPQIPREEKDQYGSRVMDLEERAKQLGIFIPSLREVSSSNNPIFIIEAICSRANIFVKKSMT